MYWCSCWCQCVVTQPKPWCSCWCQCVVTQPTPWCSCWCQCVVTQPTLWCSCWCQCVITQPKPWCSCTRTHTHTHARTKYTHTHICTSSPPNTHLKKARGDGQNESEEVSAFYTQLNVIYTGVHYYILTKNIPRQFHVFEMCYIKT